MFLVSWQLTILAFISVPLITLLSKWYGDYVRSLTKVMQQKLADGNTVSEAALSSMATVRSFDAAEKELSDFEGFMSQYLHLNLKSAIAYNGYATIATTLPELIFAVVGTFAFATAQIWLRFVLIVNRDFIEQCSMAACLSGTGT
jgi:ABC-type multidrug transport system fused ATPase/permease subunit